MAENRHIFNNLTQVEKIKPKIDNPIIVEDVTYNFSDLIENEWISHFPQYSHRMRSTFVKGAGIVDEHLANINQCLIQLEDELYRVYDKLSDDKKAEVTEFIQARQDEVNEFIQARKDEVATFISDRKTEVADFIKDRKNEVATFISEKQHLVDEFVQARQNEVANFIQSKTNEVSNYISQKENQITKFIENKDNEINKRTETLDNYTKNLEGKIEQFNLVIQGGEATEDKLGLIRLSTISEQVQVATVENLKKALITPNFKDTTPVKWSVNLTVQYGSKEKKIVVDNLNKTKLDYVFDSSNYSEFANYHKQTETITRADEEVKNVDKTIYLKLKQVTVRWHVTSEDGKINKTIEEVVATQDSTFIYRLDPSKYTELAKYCLTSDLNAVSIEPDKSEVVEGIIKLQLKQEHPSPEATPVPEPEPDPENPSGGGTGNHLKQEDKVITQKDVTDSFFNTKEEIEAEMESLIKDKVSTRKLKVNDKVYTMGLVKKIKINLLNVSGSDAKKRIDFYDGDYTITTLQEHPQPIPKINSDNSTTYRFEWKDGTIDYIDYKESPVPPIPNNNGPLIKKEYQFNFDYEENLKIEENIFRDIRKDFFTKEIYKFLYIWVKIRDDIVNKLKEESENISIEFLEKVINSPISININGKETHLEAFLLYPIIEPQLEA